MKQFLVVPILCLLLAASLSARAAGFDHTYKRYAEVLTNCVKEGRIDYRDLSLSHSDLEKAIKEMAQVTEPEFTAWPRAKETAYCINLYNACAMMFIATNYPTSNVRALGKITESPWKMAFVPLFGTKVSLDFLQHNILRKRLFEPRHHFALVFGAMGYPPARPEPYRPDTLDTQLDDQARLFLKDDKNNQIDFKRNVMWLSPLFKWFGEDFTNRTAITTYVRPYLETNTAAQVTATLKGGEEFKVDYNDFDWSMNDTRGE
jgi:hypothetical protein